MGEETKRRGVGGGSDWGAEGEGRVDKNSGGGCGARRRRRTQS